MACLFHKWDGCKCKKCGKVRDTGHRWMMVDGRCAEKCQICGQEREVPHAFQKAESKCVEVCTHCGLERPVLHEFVDGICKNCGISKSSLGTEAYVKASENMPNTGNCAEMADWLDSIFALYEGQGSWELIEPAVRNYSALFSGIDAELKKSRILSPEVKDDTLSEHWGGCAEICMRHYFSRRFTNGDFDLENAETEFKKLASQTQPGSFNSAGMRDYLAGKLETALKDYSFSGPMQFAAGISGKEFCDRFMQTALYSTDLAGDLPKLVYDSVAAYAGEILKETYSAD